MSYLTIIYGGDRGYELFFSINTANQFRIDWTKTTGPYSAVRVYKVIGIY